MSIARYDLTEDCTTGKVDITPVPETMEGRYVSYEDYAALEAKCAALAAENACLKQSIEEVADAFETGTDGVIATAVDEALNLLTPETDAVLKRIQAQGVEMAMDHIQETGSLTFGDCYVALNGLVDELRNGGSK